MNVSDDTIMCQHAKRRAHVRITAPGEPDRYGQLVAWRPHREPGGEGFRRYTARVRLNGQLTDRTINLTTHHIEVLP